MISKIMYMRVFVAAKNKYFLLCHCVVIIFARFDWPFFNYYKYSLMNRKKKYYPKYGQLCGQSKFRNSNNISKCCFGKKKKGLFCLPLHADIKKYPHSVISRLKSKWTTGRVWPLQVNGIWRKLDIIYKKNFPLTFGFYFPHLLFSAINKLL